MEILIKFKNGKIVRKELIVCFKANEKKYLLIQDDKRSEYVLLYRIENSLLMTTRFTERWSVKRVLVEIKFSDGQYEGLIEINENVVFEAEKNEEERFFDDSYEFGGIEVLKKNYNKCKSKELLFEKKEVETSSLLVERPERSFGVAALNKKQETSVSKEEIKLQPNFSYKQKNSLTMGKVEEVLAYLCNGLEDSPDTPAARHEQQKGLEVFRETTEMFTDKDMQDLEYIGVYKNSFSRVRSRFDEPSRVSLTSKKRK